MLFTAGKNFVIAVCVIALRYCAGMTLFVHCSRSDARAGPENGLNSLKVGYAAATSLKSPARIFAVGTL